MTQSLLERLERAMHWFGKDHHDNCRIHRMDGNCTCGAEARSEIDKALIECVRALDKTGKVDAPSASDKIAWIVMLESICVLARESLAALDSALAKSEGK
ncbi:MAG: hypothetical protein V4440_10320 [Pseudomonadota bacterium]